MTGADLAPPKRSIEDNRHGSLVRFGLSLLIEVPRFVAGFVTFSFLVLLLDPALYGQVGTMVAIAAIVGPIATFGASWRMLQRIVGSAAPKADLSLAASVTVVGTLAGSVFVALVAPYLLRGTVDGTTVLIFLVGQVSCLWLLELTIVYTVGIGRLALGAVIRMTSTVIRIATVIVFAVGSDHSVRSWVWHLTISMAASTVSAYVLLQRNSEGRVRWRQPSLAEFGEGIPYSLGSTTESFLAASDRPIMQRSGWEVATGTYAAGYRIITLAFVPLIALLKAHDRRVFTAGLDGIRPAYLAGKRVAKTATLLMLGVSVLVFLGATLLESILVSVRPEYEETASVVRWLAVLPLVKAIQFSFGNVLTASREQTSRVKLTMAATVVNIVGNVAFIPSGSWKAAVGTTLVAEAILAASLWRACWKLAQASKGER